MRNNSSLLNYLGLLKYLYCSYPTLNHVTSFVPLNLPHHTYLDSRCTIGAESGVSYFIENWIQTKVEHFYANVFTRLSLRVSRLGRLLKVFEKRTVIVYQWGCFALKSSVFIANTIEFAQKALWINLFAFGGLQNYVALRIANCTTFWLT